MSGNIVSLQAARDARSPHMQGRAVCVECPTQATVLPQLVPMDADRRCPPAGDYSLAPPATLPLARWKRVALIAGGVLLARHLWMEADEHHGGNTPSGPDSCPKHYDCD